MNQLSMTLPAAVADLEALLSQLQNSDREFADSLINGQYGYKKRGYLTPKQEPHVYRLLQKAMGVSELGKTHVGGMQGIHLLFEKAKSHLKFPKIVVTLETGTAIKMWIQGEKAKVPGALAVTVNGNWAGRITQDGSFETAKNFTPDHFYTDGVVDFLKQFAADPAGVAAKYGKLSSNCCFCQTALTDPKSLGVGYGPTCAKHYGLPWGAEKLTLTQVTQ